MKRWIIVQINRPYNEPITLGKMYEDPDALAAELTHAGCRFRREDGLTSVLFIVISPPTT